MTQPREHGHRVVENIAPSLHTLIQPACAVFPLVDWYGERLASAVVNGIDNSHVELVGVFCQVMSTGHACGESGSAADRPCVMTTSNPPAAPAPTTKTLFFFELSTLGAMLKPVEEAVRDRSKGSEDWRIALWIYCCGGWTMVACDERESVCGPVRGERRLNGHLPTDCVMMWKSKPIVGIGLFPVSSVDPDQIHREISEQP